MCLTACYKIICTIYTFEIGPMYIDTHQCIPDRCALQLRAQRAHSLSVNAFCHGLLCPREYRPTALRVVAYRTLSYADYCYNLSR